MWILCTGLWTMLLLAKLCAVLPLSDVSQYLHEMMHMTVFLWVWCAFIRDSGQIWQILLLRALCPSKRQQVAEMYSLINYSSETERHFISTSWYSLHLQLASVFVFFCFWTVYNCPFYNVLLTWTVYNCPFYNICWLLGDIFLGHFDRIWLSWGLMEFGHCPEAWPSLTTILKLDGVWPSQGLTKFDSSLSLTEFDCHLEAWHCLTIVLKLDRVWPPPEAWHCLTIVLKLDRVWLSSWSLTVFNHCPEAWQGLTTILRLDSV